MNNTPTNPDIGTAPFKKIYNENEGWKCPSCGTVWSPSVKECTKCNTFEDFSDSRTFLQE